MLMMAQRKKYSICDVVHFVTSGDISTYQIYLIKNNDVNLSDDNNSENAD